MPRKHPHASNQLKRKQSSLEDSDEQFNELSSPSFNDDPPSKHPKLSSPTSSSSTTTPLITSTSTSTNTTNTTIMNSSNTEPLCPDTVFLILQYVSMQDWFKICQWVSKTWRQKVLEQQVLRVELGSIISSRYSQKQSNLYLITVESLLKSEFIGKVVSLKLKNVSSELLELLKRYSSSLSNVQHLNVEENILGVKGVKFLIQLGLSCKKLTSFNLSGSQRLGGKKETLDILSSKLLANCKKLKFTNKLNNLLTDLAGISQLSQLTHLKLNQEGHDDGLELFLQSKVNLQYLSLHGHNLQSSSNLFSINSTSTNTVIFNHLTKLNVSNCNITNQMLFNIILSPKLPNLTTLIASNINQGDKINTPSIPSIPSTTGNTNSSTLYSIGGGGVGYRNSSNLTELNMNDSRVHPVAEMIKFTSKLKKLLICDLRDWHANDYKLVQDYSFLVHTDSKLSQLEYLEITRSTGWMELVLTNSMFSNLKYLNCKAQWNKIREDELDREVKIIEECVNLPKLERVSKTLVKVGDITKEKEVKVLKAFRNNPMFNSNRLKIEDFSYETVYPNVEKNDDSIKLLN